MRRAADDAHGVNRARDDDAAGVLGGAAEDCEGDIEGEESVGGRLKWLSVILSASWVELQRFVMDTSSAKNRRIRAKSGFP